MRNWTLMGLAAALIGFGIVGCTPQAREEYSKAGDESAKAAADTGKAVKTDAQVTGEVAKDAAQEAGKKVDNATLTGQVRAAFSNARDLKIDDLNVDTMDNKVVIHGTAHSQADKDKAEALAKGTVPKDYTVDNQLSVAGAPAGNAGK